jgi:hypothetical protein
VDSRVCPAAPDGTETRCFELNFLSSSTVRFIFVNSLTLGYTSHTVLMSHMDPQVVPQHHLRTCPYTHLTYRIHLQLSCVPHQTARVYRQQCSSYCQQTENYTKCSRERHVYLELHKFTSITVRALPVPLDLLQ